jgi:proline iminopeptidase
MKPLEKLLSANPSAIEIRVHLKEVELLQQSRQGDLNVVENDKRIKAQEAVFAEKDGRKEALGNVSRETKRIEIESMIINNDLRCLKRTRTVLMYLLRRVEEMEGRKDSKSAENLILRFTKSAFQKAIDSAEIEDEDFERLLEELLGENGEAADQGITKDDRVVLASASIDKHECVLDRKVHLEPEAITSIPEVSRLCDELSLSKRKINIGDCALYAEEEGAGIPLVLLHGGPGCTHHLFHPWFSRARDYARIIYFDQRGCGLSDFEPGEDGYSVDQAAADVDALRNALGIDRWVVLGHSYGGALAQYYALKYPDRLAGLILVSALPGIWCDLKPGREVDFISLRERIQMSAIEEELDKLFREEKWSHEKYQELLVYNLHLNGDWKRQYFYKPSSECLARMALYEWRYDYKNSFRGRISKSLDKIDMTGAFAGCPIPTLIMEGQWDLTWNDDKPDILTNNHPDAKLERFKNAGHSIFSEDPDGFFSAIQNFLGHLPAIPPALLTDYKKHLSRWKDNQETSPFHIVHAADQGRSSMARLAAAYKREWCDSIDIKCLLKLGFAQYEAARYEEACYIFGRLLKEAEEKKQYVYTPLALIWQGHTLDLLEKRTDAIDCYKQVAMMCIKSQCTQNQYGLSFQYSPYAVARMITPFVRLENLYED